MSRLSIVIPACRDQGSLESTLLSVLENRPAGCEILVVCDPAYQDEYSLDDEIRFVRLPAGSRRRWRWQAMANVGLAESGGEILHLLQPGVLVDESWVDSAIEIFDYEADVAAVCPLIFVDDRPAPITGVGAGPGGKRLEIQQGTMTNSSEHRLAPTSLAGFFRRSSLIQVGGWDPKIAAEYADVELGCALALNGSRFQLASLCHLKSTDVETPKTTGFTVGLASEMIIRRYAGVDIQQLANSSLTATIEGFGTATSLGYLLGRMAGRFRSARRTKAVDLNVQQRERIAKRSCAA